MLDASFLTDVFILLCTGCVAGVLSGLFGIGGGVVLVPVLLYVFTMQGYSPEIIMHLSVGTSLAIMIPTGLSSARAHASKGSFNKSAFMNWAPGILIGVGLGTFLASQLDGEKLKTIFAIAICFLAALMQIDPKKLARKKNANKETLPSDTKQVDGLTNPPPSMPLLSSLGIGVGTLSSLMGIGGATMTVPSMSLLGMNIRESVATASALGVLISVPAALGFAFIGEDVLAGKSEIGFFDQYILGYINLFAAVIILPASILCTKLGVYFAHRLPFKHLKQIFSLFMVFLAARMLWSVFG
jgi:uncharacterized membrane protein YfcA